MKNMENIFIWIALVSLCAAFISRYTVTLVPLAPWGGYEARTFLIFANTCLLIAITLMLKK